MDCSAVLPMSIKEWLQHSSSFEYLPLAVDLALRLTKRVVHLVAAGEMNSRDVVAENVRIILAEAPRTPDGPPSVAAVRFGTADVRRDDDDDAPPRDAEDDAPPDSSAVRAALGDVLLEIFSGGRSSSSDRRAKASDGGAGGNGSPAGGGDDDGERATPSATKRTAAASIGGGSDASDGARRLLLDAGMPPSVCRLVCDLIDAAGEPSSPRHAPVTLEDAARDLERMRSDPEPFLFGRACPRKALDDTCLFDGADDGRLFGREGEVGSLTAARDRVSAHVRGGRAGTDGTGGADPLRIGGGGDLLLGEAAFLSGYAGSGKSAILRSLIRSCEEEGGWFVLRCKFDERSVPSTVMAKAFDDFFGGYVRSAAENDDDDDDDGVPRSCPDPSASEPFYRVCRTIFNTVDNEGFGQLCEIVPNFSRVFPLLSTRSRGRDEDGSSKDKVGAANERRIYLIRLLFKSVCSGGRPVLFALDDLQWSDSFVMEGIRDFFLDYIHVASSAGQRSRRQGIMVAGTYRSNEAGEHLAEPIKSMENSEKVNFVRLDVGELKQRDVAQLISARLFLPTRSVRNLAEVVRRKTRGNPFFVVQFLKSVLRNKMISFSLKERQWTWDCDVIDMQMMPDGVAELLTSTTFRRLPARLMQTLKILSCLGSQVEDQTIDALNSGRQVLSHDMRDELPVAIEEGVLERAGPVYQLTHDLVQQATYDLIAPRNRTLLHKTIGTRLLNSAGDNREVFQIAVDQINISCEVADDLSAEERSRFAGANSAAARFALSASSFEQARSYIDTGINLLRSRGTDHWDDQYSLSLELFEMSASVSCTHGDVGRMSSSLDEILSRARTFDDGLNASAMLARLLASSSRHDDAAANCLSILSSLGEDFPRRGRPLLPDVLERLSATRSALRNLTVDGVKLLPPMTDGTKLNAMKFLSMLCTHCSMCRPMLLPILSCRMVELTLGHGFCDDSIVGLIVTSYGMMLFTDDIHEAYRVGKVGEYLREESPNKHRLRAGLCQMWEGSVKILVEPAQAVTATFPLLLESAMLAGDVESAMLCRYSYCSSAFYIGENLPILLRHFELCIQQSVKYQQEAICLIAMAVFHAPLHLSGKGNGGELKSYEELHQIGEQSNNSLLLWTVFMSRISKSFWLREFAEVIELCDKYPPSTHKRILEWIRCFFQGIASLNLARRTRQPKRRVVGEEAVKTFAKLELINKWSVENKSQLLQAELHYLNGRLDSAEAAYKASVESARDRRFVHEEALAYELYGIFRLENRMVGKGAKQLNAALEKYKRWGAMKKAEVLQRFIATV